MNFETKLSGNNVTVYNISKKNHDVESSFMVDWSFVTEMRQWGVKSMYLYVNKVCGQIDVNYWDDENSMPIPILIDSSMEEHDGEKWAIDVDKSELEFGDCVQPKDIYVDFDNKSIIVNTTPID